MVAPNENTETMATQEHFRSSETEDFDLHSLESELNQMANKILEYRTTLPDQLKSTLLTLLEAHRPIQPSIQALTNPDSSERNTGEGSSTPEDLEAVKKVKLLNEKISHNLSSMPVVLKRMKDCIAKIDKLDSYNAEIIHPAFKRKKTGQT